MAADVATSVDDDEYGISNLLWRAAAKARIPRPTKMLCRRGFSSTFVGRAPWKMGIGENSLSLPPIIHFKSVVADMRGKPPRRHARDSLKTVVPDEQSDSPEPNFVSTRK